MTLRFTEHALFRYCQRVLGADVTWLKESLAKQITLTHDGHHKLKDYDAYAVIKDGHVVSIMTEAQVKAMRRKPVALRFKEVKEDW